MDHRQVGLGSRARQGWIRFLANHNPFYVISACLVLYGIHRSFQASEDLADGWLLFQLLAFYSAMLLVSATLIVRWGAVWEDARTIVVLILILMVALSSSFDRLCLDDVTAGRTIQSLGFVVCVAMIECLLRGVRARLPFRYRGPLYAIYALLFAYPTWLGQLSLAGEQERMAWYVFLFPWAAGACLLLLVPAVRRGGRGETPNGTPWNWPWYPWCGLAFLAAALVVRSYGLSVAFELAGGLDTAFQPYYLIPLLLALLVISVELALVCERRSIAESLLACSSILLALAMPGGKLAAVPEAFLSTVSETWGAPIQWCSLLLGLVLGHYWFRKCTVAEMGVYVCALLFICSTPQSWSLALLAWPQPLSASALIGLLVVRSWACRSSWQFLLAAALSLVAVTTSETFYDVVGVIYLVSTALLLAGWAFDDPIARALSRSAHWLAGIAAVAILYTGIQFGGPAESSRVALALAGIDILMALFWWRERSLKRLVQTLAFLGLSVVHSMCWAYLLIFEEWLELAGGVWLLAGWAALAAGLLLSLLKGGVISRWRAKLRRMHRLLDNKTMKSEGT